MDESLALSCGAAISMAGRGYLFMAGRDGSFPVFLASFN